MIPPFQVLFGAACAKSVADIRMATHLVQPSVLVLAGALEYERVHGKFCSIDPVITQEAKHLNNVVQRLVSLHPDIVVVEKSVARLARRYLRDAGVTLINGLRQKQLRRIARCTQAEVFGITFLQGLSLQGVG